MMLASLISRSSTCFEVWSFGATQSCKQALQLNQERKLTKQITEKEEMFWSDTKLQALQPNHE